jgi:hypothetical protein
MQNRNANQGQRGPRSEAEGLVQCGRVEVWVGRDNRTLFVRDGARLRNLVPLFRNLFSHFLVAKSILLRVRGRRRCHVQYTGYLKIEVFGPLEVKLK